MKTLPVTRERLLNARLVNKTGCEATLHIPETGGGLDVSEIAGETQRYLVFYAECAEEHSLILNLNVYEKAEDAQPAFFMRFGLLPRFRAKICLDIQCLNAEILFPESNPGQLKVVCHGRRVERSAVKKITLAVPPCFHPVTLTLSDLILTDAFPDEFPLPGGKLIDELGQLKTKTWQGKAENAQAMGQSLRGALELPDAFSIGGWDPYGGYAARKVQPGTGFFTKARADGRWTLVDPLGNAFFSVGPDCVIVRSDCRVDKLEHLLDWLPAETDPVYGGMYRHAHWPLRDAPSHRDCTLFSFPQANLYRAFGSDWHGQWQRLMSRQLKRGGFNTLGNWSDPESLGVLPLPYVTMLAEFPDTKTHIFRDFPDVFAPEYAENALRCAQTLKHRADDPLMIGYFLRNEPEWAFVDGLILADEVLYNPYPSACKRRLIDWLAQKYQVAEALSDAWQHPLEDFQALHRPIRNASALSPQAKRDLKTFSAFMLNAYVEIISAACRAADINHMNLGMRWAWISDPDLITGWQNFDVFSINCYAAVPTAALDRVVALGVDLPVMIGEYHFGALDWGQTATGLEAVENQAERAVAYQVYTEHAAKHPACVGCHWFQCYDQFALGRFDGENYNIGLFDVCSRPNEIMMQGTRTTAQRLYPVMFGALEPAANRPRSIPMIAY